MKILEAEAKLLLGDRGLPVPAGRIAASPEEAAAAAGSLGGPAVLKAQIPANRRMQAGGILFAQNPEETRAAASRLLGATILNLPVDHILVERRLAIAREIYLGVTYDSRERRPVLLASGAGGAGIESAATVVKRPLSARLPAPGYLGREIAEELGLCGRQLLAFAGLVRPLVECFFEWDALLLELNPAVLDFEDRAWVADAHLELDDDALYRQGRLCSRTPRSARAAAEVSEFERRAAEIDRADHRGVAGRLIPFGGALGLLAGGGGASLAAMDALLEAGLEPANYCEIGGNPSVWKVQELTKLILSQPGVERLAVIMNVVSNTRVDLVARGVIKGILELGRDPADAIAAFRIPGSWEQEGGEILARYGVRFYGRETSIDQVAAEIRCRS